MKRAGFFTFRVCGFNLFSVVLTVVLFWLFFWLIQWRVGKMSPWMSLASGLGLSLLFSIPLTVFRHTLFGTPTVINCALKLTKPSKCEAFRAKIAAQ